MHFVGVDLAWSDGNDSGVCATDDGAVVATALLRHDDELLGWLEGYTQGPCVVAFDAPLILRNTTGARPCERALNRCFARYEAGCHPTNSARIPPRAERLTTRLRLRTDPWFPARQPVRRAIEVYPHAAQVALFELDRTLKYKAGTDRSIEDRRHAFRLFVGLLQSLREAEPGLDVDRAPRWRELAQTVTTSATHAALDRAEDELDAMVCAYVAAHYWTHGLDRNRVVGDARTGAIVTPITAELARCLDAGAGAP